MVKAALALALTLALDGSLPAKDHPGKGHGRDKHAQASAFRPSDRTLILDYYRSSPSGLPPGLAKRNGDLPPGLQKQLRRNGRLPPGLEKRFTPFPVALEQRLPPCPPDIRRGLVGGVAVMYSAHTGLIVDALTLF